MRTLTFEEFLDWCDSDTRAEWVNGRVVILSPENAVHKRVSFFLAKLLSIYVEKHRLGEVFTEGILMRLEATRSARMPDAVFVARSRADRVQETFIDGAADLAVEIVSPDSIERDRSEKFLEYQTAGIREYWLIDPANNFADFFELGADRRYYPVPLCDGAFRSTVVPGFWLKPAWLWQDPLPETLDVLRELGVIARQD